MIQVKVYSTPTCAYCFALKDFLKDNGIEFEDIDVAADTQQRDEMIRKSNQMEVPVVEINGQIVVGFDKEKLIGLLNITEN
jgi:glutaredoxin-like YruB-family protein